MIVRVHRRMQSASIGTAGIGSLFVVITLTSPPNYIVIRYQQGPVAYVSKNMVSYKVKIKEGHGGIR